MAMLSKFFSNKKVLITGNTGFKGSWLSQILVNFGADVTGCSLKPRTNPNLFSILGLKSQTNTQIFDVRNFSRLKKVVKDSKPDVVFHLAAQPLVIESYRRPRYTFDVNMMSTVNVLEAVREIGDIPSVVVITTDKVYKDKEASTPYNENSELGGHDPYSTSKACNELIVESYIKSFFPPDEYGKKHSTLVASTRAGNVLGGGDWSGDRIVPDLMRSIFEKHRPIELRMPGAVRPWQHVLEPLRGYMLISKKLYEGSTGYSGAWNFGPKGNLMSVEKLVRACIDAVGQGSYVSKSAKGLGHETEILRLDSSKAEGMLDWEHSMSMSEIVRMTMSWYSTYYDEGSQAARKLTDKQIQDYFTSQRV